MGLAGEPKLKERGATDPLKPKMNIIEKEEVSSLKPMITEKNNTKEEGLAQKKERIERGRGT